MSEHIITGIDVGTYQVKVAIVRVPKTRDERILPQIIGTGFAESRGLRNGYIINEADVVRSIRSAVAQAEKAAGVSVKKAYLSIGSIGQAKSSLREQILKSPKLTLKRRLPTVKSALLTTFRIAKLFMLFPCDTVLMVKRSWVNPKG
jgi:Ethanolamine utilization protein EutJ (predicted chaperonin)